MFNGEANRRRIAMARNRRIINATLRKPVRIIEISPAPKDFPQTGDVFVAKPPQQESE